MSKKISSILIFLFCAHIYMGAQESTQNINHNYDLVFETLNPLSLTSTPVAMYYNPLDSISQLAMGYNLKSGNFRRVMDSEQSHTFRLNTENYRKINKTMLYGQFQFSKDWDKGHHFSNLYNPYKGSPYLLIDTIGGDNISKEEYQLSAKIAHPLGDNSLLAAAIDYKVGLEAQDTDPRALNKVVTLNTKIGLLRNWNTAKIGLDIDYNYSNEDIEINVVQKDTAHLLYALSGLGSYSSRSASSFYRLYKKHTLGGHLLYEAKANILNLGFHQSEEITQDGHKEGDATWSGVKTDSKYQEKKLSLLDIYTYKRGSTVHQFIITAEQNTYVGTEVQQSLEQVDSETSTLQWYTISEDEKYDKSIYKASLKYSFTKFKTELLRDYSLSFKVDYYDHQENYYPHSNNVSYANLNYSCQGAKLFKLKNGNLDALISAGYQQNIKHNVNLPYTSEITDLIIRPDLDYATSNFVMGGTSLTYTTALKTTQLLFITTNYALQKANNTKGSAQNRHFTALSLGLIF